MLPNVHCVCETRLYQRWIECVSERKKATQLWNFKAKAPELCCRIVSSVLWKYAQNLSISLWAGMESNREATSSGEWTWHLPEVGCLLPLHVQSDQAGVFQGILASSVRAWCLRNGSELQTREDKSSVWFSKHQLSVPSACLQNLTCLQLQVNGVFASKLQRLFKACSLKGWDNSLSPIVDNHSDGKVKEHSEKRVKQHVKPACKRQTYPFSFLARGSKYLSSVVA